MIVDADGVPIEFGFSSASTANIERLHQLPIHLPEGSRLHADKAYLRTSAPSEALRAALRAHKHTSGPSKPPQIRD